jgi:hypothetical protein
VQPRFVDVIKAFTLTTEIGECTIEEQLAGGQNCPLLLVRDARAAKVAPLGLVTRGYNTPKTLLMAALQ